MNQLTNNIHHGIRCAFIAILLLPCHVLLNAASTKNVANGNGRGDCGAKCMKAILEMYGQPAEYDTLFRQLGIEQNMSTSFLLLKNVAKQRGFKVDALKMLPHELLKAQTPAIAYVRGNHFVAVIAVDTESKRLLVYDPPNPLQWISLKAFAEEWNGETLLFSFLGNHPKLGGLWVPYNTIGLGKFNGTKAEKKSVIVVNISDVELSISDFKFSCSCATASVEPSVIAPHSVGEIKLDVDTSNKPQGRFDLKMFIKTNSKDRPVATFNFFGIVQHPYKAYPSFIALGDIPPDQGKQEMAIKVYFGQDADVEVQAVHLGPGISLTDCRKISNDLYKVILTFDVTAVKPAKDGRFRNLIVLGTCRDNDPNIAIGVVGRLLPKVAIIPSQLYLNSIEPGKHVFKKIRLDIKTKANRISSKIYSEANNQLKFEITLINNANGLVRKINFEPPWLSLDIVAPQKHGIVKENCILEVNGETVLLPIVGIVR